MKMDLPLQTPGALQPPLLQKALEAHGGLARWCSTSRIDVHLRIRPWFFLGRFLPASLRTLTAQIETRRVRAILAPYPVAGQRGVFEGDSVRIESLEGELLEQLAGARASARRRIVWNPLHALYFLGYALWNYTQAPFLFAQPGFEVAELEPWREGDESWQRLQIRFPPGFPTHCRDQIYYFDAGGLLRRLDYVAEIFSPLARGAHRCEDHRSFSGLVYPTHRWVRPIGPSGRPWPFPTVIEGWIDGMDVHADTPP